MQNASPVQINTQRIPVGRGWGALGLIALLLVALAVELPGVRVAVWGAALGLLLAPSLIWWRRR